MFEQLSRREIFRLFYAGRAPTYLRRYLWPVVRESRLLYYTDEQNVRPTIMATVVRTRICSVYVRHTRTVVKIVNSSIIEPDACTSLLLNVFVLRVNPLASRGRVPRCTDFASLRVISSMKYSVVSA